MDAEEWKAAHKRAKAYYQYPDIQWIEPSDSAAMRAAGGPLQGAGFYILHSCGEPSCCRPAGPFPTEEEALAHSRRELVAQAEARYLSKPNPPSR